MIASKIDNKKIFWQCFKYFVCVIGLSVIAISGYYTWEVLRARAETPSIIKKALESDNIVIMPEDLTFDEYLSLIDFRNPDFINPHVNPAGNRRLVLSLKQRLSEGGNDSPTTK